MSRLVPIYINMQNTKTKGATYENKKPTFRGSMNYDKVIRRKNRLKKYLNWSNNTIGMNVIILYF